METFLVTTIYHSKGSFTRSGSGCDSGAAINWIPLLQVESFTQALATAVAAEVQQGAASKWVPTPFSAAVAAAKHFSPIAAPMPQPLPHRVNEP